MNIIQWIDDNKPRLTHLSNQIWEFAEPRYRETKSAALLAKTLSGAGFRVQSGVAEIPTAFVASYGTDKPIIAILGEYDALPGLSQDRVTHKKPIQVEAPGHGCGHNLLGVGSLAAALAVAKAIQTGDVKGTIRYYGCPAEEGGAAKAFMAKAGAFKDVDISLTWHPGTLNNCTAINILASIKAIFKFHGRASHAAADPFNGRSALDAVELMNVGANYLREHIIPEARIHYIITKGGGAPNVVPEFASSFYYVRSPELYDAMEILERVKDIARGAALMTGTEVEFDFHSASSNLVLNDTIAQVLHAKMEEIGAPQFDPAETQFARAIANTFPQGSDKGTWRMIKQTFGAQARQVTEMLKGSLLATQILPAVKNEAHMSGSTDVGDVSWVTPTGQFTTTCGAFGTPGHSWQLAAQSGMGIGYAGMFFAGKILAAAAIEFMQKPELVKQAREEFELKLKETPYVSPIPDGAKAPIGRDDD